MGKQFSELPQRKLPTDRRPNALGRRFLVESANGTPETESGSFSLLPSGENTTRRATHEDCQECDRLEAAYEAVIEGIQQAIHGPETLSDKLAKMYLKQDERDGILRELYAHKSKAHSQNTV